MKRKKKRVIFCGFIVLFGILFLHFYIPRFVTEIRNPLIVLLKNELKLPEFKEGKEIAFLSEEGYQQYAHISFSELDSVKATIILVHGIRSKKEHFVQLSEKLTKQGFNTVAIDLRAHGKSQGKHCTFGVKEKEDIKRLINELENQELKGSIGIWGQSLGGAVALQSLASDNRIQFGIVESTFSEFQLIVGDYFADYTGVQIPFFTKYLAKRASSIANFNIKEANPNSICAKITQPILLVHGDSDQKIDVKYSYHNFNKIASKNKQHLIINYAGHLNVWDKGTGLYFNQVSGFVVSALIKE